MRVALHFEMGNEGLFESLIKSTQRYFLKPSDLIQNPKLYYKLEIACIKYLQQISKEKNKSTRILTLKNIKEHLIINFKPGSEKKSIYTLFLHWLESKIQNKSYEHIIKQMNSK